MLSFSTDTNGHRLRINESYRNGVAGLKARCESCTFGDIGDYDMEHYSKYRLALDKAKTDALSHAGVDIAVWHVVDSR